MQRFDPYKVVREFESALSDYTGAPFVVTTTSCTMALLLALSYWRTRVTDNFIRIPNYTYVGVPMSIRHAGFSVLFHENTWSGGYQLLDTPIWDFARRFTSGMYESGQLQCLSFHPTKILGLSGHGGAILLDGADEAEWLRQARFDGRTEGVSASKDIPRHRGYHAYMAPTTAAEGILRLSTLPANNLDLPCSDYPDLIGMKVFQ